MLLLQGSRMHLRGLRGERLKKGTRSQVVVRHLGIEGEGEVGVVDLEGDVVEVEGALRCLVPRMRLGRSRQGSGKRRVKGVERIIIDGIRELGRWLEVDFLAEVIGPMIALRTRQSILHHLQNYCPSHDRPPHSPDHVYSVLKRR